MGKQSMSNQYYKFLANQLLGYLDDTHLVEGNRYYLILNSEEEISNLEQEINNLNYSNISRFSSPEFNFSTASYHVEGIDTILVFAKQNVTHDFLVTIRNKVSLQKHE